MGYEIQLIVGNSASTATREFERQTEPVICSDGEVWYPLVKDDKGELVHTGRMERYFFVYGMIDLCKPGGDSHLLKLDWRNKDHHRLFWKYYMGTQEVTEDLYGDYAQPLPIKDVIEALEKDSAEDDYRRFKWALGMLRAMPKDAEVLFYGH